MFMLEVGVSWYFYLCANKFESKKTKYALIRDFFRYIERKTDVKYQHLFEPKQSSWGVERPHGGKDEAAGDDDHINTNPSSAPP